METDAVAAGVEYFHNCKASNFEISKDRICMDYQKGSQLRISEAKIVVIACGFNSGLFNKGIDIGKTHNYTVGAQIEVHHRDVEGIEIYTGKHIAPGFFGWLVPLDDKKALVGLMSKYNPNKYLKGFSLLLKSREDKC
jgi:flavin-dependent dehydrogenase